jgi:phosphate transport system permease protein
MNPSAMNPNRQSQARPKGEVYVWVTGMGLMVGLLMIAFLLTLIVRNGVGVFWPKRVALVSFADGSGFRTSSQVAGIIMEEQEKDARDLAPEQLASPDPRDRREKKLFVGNRDLYGESFAYFMLGDIESVTYPKEIIMAERLEWGNAIFWPLRIEFSDGSALGVEAETFRATLRNLVEEVRERRKVINRIERRQIGRINLQMRELELEQRFFDSQEELTPAQETEQTRIRERLASLREEYDPLAARAGQLRAQQRETTLHFRLATGEERSLPIGDIVHFHYPNELGLVQRTLLFGRQIWDFLTSYPREANTEGGIWPAIFGTVVMTLIMSVAVTPFGVLAAIYLREYARQGPLVRSVRIAVNNLAGVPSIVFGIFGLGFFVYLVGGTIDQVFYPRALASNTPTFGTCGILWASLTLALMTVPVVIVATEEAIAAVSRGVREGSLACGASKWQTIQRLVLPASLPGILTGLVLAMARGAGEVAPLILVGVVALAPNLPLDATFPFIHLERKFMHLGFHIYDLGFQSPDSEAAKPMVFATTLVLILLVIVLNLAAILIRNHLRKKYAAAKF